MPEAKVVTQHYTHGRLVDAIRDGIEKLGKSTDNVLADDLAPVDEFHIGGRVATEEFLDQIGITGDQHLLDVGCGLGGASRFAALRYGCQVTGVDLTPEYIETGNVMCQWLGLAGRIDLQVENAIALPHADNTFDGAFLLHVGMNIADKRALISELYRVVRPRGKLGIYDVMRVNAGDLEFPVPWATEPGGSSVSPPEVYRSAMKSAGFKIIAQRNRRDFALDFFAQIKKKVSDAGGPPPLGLHILMGETAPVKIKNMIENISRGLLAPVELIAVKDA